MDRRRLAAAAGWATLAVLALLAAGGAARTPDGLLIGLPPLPAAAAILAGVAALAALVPREAAAPVAGFALVPGLLLAGGALPGTAAWSGPPLFAFALAGAALVLARARPSLEARLFLPVVLVLYLAGAARVQSQVGPAGDEPHYLMAADSLLRDGDLALERDYAEGRYRAFHPAPLEPHYRLRGRGGEIYSLHAVGLSVLVLPAYAAGGYRGASFFMAVLAALLAWQVRRLVGNVTDEGRAGAAGWIVALGPPLAHYAGLIFTEVPAALAVAFALRAGVLPSVPGPTPRSALAAGAAVAALPWLNVRYAAPAAILAACVLVRRPAPRVTAAWLAPLALSAAGLALFHHRLYGFFDPRRVYGRRPELSLAGAPEGLAGLLLDQEFGLLVYAPVFALAVAGAPALARRSRLLAVAAAALVVATLGTAASWPMWRGGWNPPARLLVPALPALALGFAGALRPGLGSATALLAGWTVWAGLAGLAEPRLMHRDRDGTAPFFRALSGGEEWTRLLPGYVRPEPAPGRDRLAAIWALALGFAAAAGARRRGETATVRSAAVAAVAAIGAAGAASAVAGASTGARDAVRVLGRPALAIPRAAFKTSAPARWRADALAWGPVYEPHRHPDGALIGDRLPLAEGAYEVTIAAATLASVEPPLLELRTEGRDPARRQVRLVPGSGGLQGPIDVRPGERAVTLLLRYGGPLRLDEVRLVRLNP